MRFLQERCGSPVWLLCRGAVERRRAPWSRDTFQKRRKRQYGFRRRQCPGGFDSENLRRKKLAGQISAVGYGPGRAIMPFRILKMI